MVRRFALVIAGYMSAFAATSMRRVALIPSGPYHEAHGRVVCCDSDHDLLPEMYFFYSPNACHQTWESQGWNRFRLVFEDTAYQDPFVRVRTAVPFAAGDIDEDGLTDVVCITVEYDSTRPDTAYDILMTLESPDNFSYPCSLTWSYRFTGLFVIPIPTYYPPDLDLDGHEEVFCAVPSMGWCIWENAGNDQNDLVWRDTIHDGCMLTFGDFDVDGRMDFATATLGSAGIASVWECTGCNQYEVVYRDTVFQPNGADLFTTNDIDGDGKPEFYVAYENVPRSTMYLYMWETVGDDEYGRTLVDSALFLGEDWGRISESGDIDGDGIDECIWTKPDGIRMYKAFGDNDLRMVWNWCSDHGELQSLVSTVYDVNGDGYNELVTAGTGKISIFEVDAIDLVSPNYGTYGVGDRVTIQWATHSPPRCDSLSLLLRVDSLWNCETIATGIPGTDTLYRWLVPEGVPDTARIVVIAYGPGWQYDVSDSAFRFISGAVAEGPRRAPLQWSLSVTPNPARGAFTVRYEVPLTLALSQREREGVREAVSLGIYDAAGRLVRSLTKGGVDLGRYEVRMPSGIFPAGVYFCTLDNGTKRISRKVVLTE